MANGSVSDEWMYNDVLDDEIMERGNLADSIDSSDLLDDVLTVPAATVTPMKPEQDDVEELSYMQDNSGIASSIPGLEDSGSARYKADVMSRTIQARINGNRTSHSIHGKVGLGIYTRDPNRKNSFFMGNLTWWTTDLDIIKSVRDAGLGDIKMLKFYENRTNGQSKGNVLIELASEQLAFAASDKLTDLTLHGQKAVMSYAGHINIHQFESRCLGKPSSEKPDPPIIKPSLNITPTTQHTIRTNKPSLPIRPPTCIPGLPPNFPPIPGFRPPVIPDIPPFPPMPPFNTSNPLMPRLPNMPGIPHFPPTNQYDPSLIAAALGAAKPAAPHLNPAFLQQEMSHGSGSGGVAELFAKAAARFQNQAMSNINAPKMPSDEEASAANQRNRAISSSAITRAMADATAGDYDSAVDILKMAITLIKQSITASSDSSLMLIQSLQDCLVSIEQQADASGGSRRSRRGYDDKDRSRSSSHRSSGGSSSKHYRDRSRERRR